MGSFNGTCMVSNLPIVCGDKVKLVLLYNPSLVIHKEDNPFIQSGICYSTAFLQPAFLPISCVYSDYGGVNDITKDWNYDLITNVLKKDLGESITIGNNKLTDWSLEDIITGIKKGDVRYTNISRKEAENKQFADMYVKSFDSDVDSSVPKAYRELAKKELKVEEHTLEMTFVMILEDVWDHLIDNYDGEFHTDLKSDDDTLPYNVSGKVYYKRKYDKYLDRIESVKSKVIGEDYDEFDKRMDMRDLKDNSIFNNAYTGGNDLYSYEDYDVVFNDDAINTDTLFKQWSELKIISSIVSKSRRLWMPQSGAGSQSEYWDMYKVLSDITIKICDDKIEERRKWDEDE